MKERNFIGVLFVCTILGGQKKRRFFLLLLLLILKILSMNALISYVASLVCFMQERVIFDSVKGLKSSTSTMSYWFA